mgnify:CR=1 FL=1
MKRVSSVEDKKYELLPVGVLRAENESVYAYIMPEYSPALKYLDLFSHAIIFYDSGREHDTGDRPGIFEYSDDSSRELTGRQGKSNVQSTVVRLLRIDEGKGIVELDHAIVQKDTAIFDIKPYFPCEDRVRDLKIPDHMRQFGLWRTDTPGAISGAGNTGGREVDFHRDLRVSLDKIGRIVKPDGECLIELDHPDESLFNCLRDFSHVKILWWFDRFDRSSYRKATLCDPPYENAPRTGVFASRSPVRPNPIALTTARVLDIDAGNRRIKVHGLDAFDKSPVIDIIPYIPACDRVKEYYVPEWLKHWPEWLDDRDTEPVNGTIKIAASDVERVRTYMATEKRKTETLREFFKNGANRAETYPNEITVKGARQNNLKNIDFSIPKNKMTVVTGVSGSGKSSLAFDTVYAESQRRFMDSMSSSVGTALSQMEKPDIDRITGLPPAVAIGQNNAGRNPRSTVGTLTDIHDYLRLLFSTAGTRHCPECGRAITPLKPDEIVALLTALKHGTVFCIRAFNGKDEPVVFSVPDHMSRGDNACEKKLKEAVTKGLSIGNGAILVTVNGTDEFLFQTKEMCYHCNRIFFELSTSTFSFNNPESMCPVCKGLGVKLDVDADLIVSSPDISILDGASKWWGDLRKFRQKPNANWMKGEILALAQSMGVDMELPWNELPENFRQQALYGSEGREVCFVYENTGGRKGEIVRPVEGAYNTITRLFREQNGETASRIASTFMREKPCTACNGERLAPEGRMVSIGETRFPETVNMTIEELNNWTCSLPDKMTEEQLKVSIPVLMQLHARLENFIEAGVPYLTLDRPVPTLSGGELQRLRLAAQLGSGITNILYVLDEPSTGLHPKDHARLIKVLERIKNNENTVLVVEHDASTMMAADHIIDMGPGAGIHGGYIVAEGTPKEIMQNPRSETGKYLAELNDKITTGRKNRKKPYGFIKIKGARCNNLKSIDAAFPLGVLCCVTGVSGSGKSSLVSKTLYPALAGHLNGSGDIPGEYDSIEGLDAVDKIISITQQPIGRTPRSNPATYTGVFDDIRNLFAATAEAKKRGYKQNRFSFNGKEGQCGACSGEGRKCVEMHFMPDIWVECSVCHGKRFNAETLEVTYKGKSVADVLDMNVEDALKFFSDDKKITNVLQTLYDVGLGYIKLGQSALTLSGGEAQRIKLAKELSKTETGKTIYLLDEPTTGLHFSDVKNLLNILQRITGAGNTVIVIEHNPDIMKNADWIIDMGPEGGKAGGNIIARGTPEEVSMIEGSHTGRLLKEILF